METYFIITLVYLLLFAVYDYRHHMIRNAALCCFLSWCLLYIPMSVRAFPEKSPVVLCAESFMGALVGFVLLFFIAYVTKGGIGGGDVKLVALLGFLFGAMGILSALFFACVLALVVEGVRACIKKAHPANIPFAPYLFMGSIPVTLYIIR